MTEPGALARLGHILDALELIRKYTRGGKRTFMRSSMVRDATIRNIEIIGEAVRALPDDLRKREPGLPWRKMIALRNVLAHDYFGLDLEIVWMVVRRHLPPLRRPIRAIVRRLKAGTSAE